MPIGDRRFVTSTKLAEAVIAITKPRWPIVRPSFRIEGTASVRMRHVEFVKVGGEGETITYDWFETEGFDIRLEIGDEEYEPQVTTDGDELQWVYEANEIDPGAVPITAHLEGTVTESTTIFHGSEMEPVDHHSEIKSVHRADSVTVTALPLPPVIHAPVVPPPLYDCAEVVHVSNLYPGAIVRAYQDGIQIGTGWAGLNSSTTVRTTVPLEAGGTVTAQQQVGTVEGPESDGIDVQEVDELPTPVVGGPVARGDREILVSGVSPGSRVAIEADGAVIGETDAAEPIIRVRVSPINGTVRATATLCDVTTASEAIAPIEDPGLPGDFTDIEEEFRSYGTMNVPATPDSDPFESPIEGQLYYPGGVGNGPDPDAGPLPLIVIAHGLWDTGDFIDGVMYYTDANTGERLPVDSHKGYDYLARHLVGWGAIVFSLRLDTVNRETTRGTSTGQTHQYARAEIILEAIRRVLDDTDLTDHIDDQRIGLVGHSMGGEAVAVAQHLNVHDDRGFAIRGVVSIAPTNWRPEVTLTDTKYLQLLGSMDLLMGGLEPVTGSRAQFSGFRIYDRAWRPKSHVWIHGARHNPFNRRWVRTTDMGEDRFADDDRVLFDHEHEHIARGLINAFFRDALADRTAYAGYVEGTVLPRNLRHLSIFVQHSSDQGRAVVDNFGDQDDQASLPQDPLDKTENSLGEANSATGDGLALWEDVEHTDLAHSPHETKGLELAWNLDVSDARFVSETGGLARDADAVLSLRAAQFFPDVERSIPNLDLDFFVQVRDASQAATVRLGAVDTIPFPHDAHQRLSVLRTIRLPLHAFVAANPDLDLTDIRSIQLLLNGQFTGHLLADDIEFNH